MSLVRFSHSRLSLSLFFVSLFSEHQNTNKMSKSLPILIDTTTASTTATITTSTPFSSLSSKPNRRPEALIPSPFDDASVETGKNVAKKRRPPSPSTSSSSLQSHLNHANVATTTTKTLAHANSIDNNHDRQHDETEAIASITRQQNDQKQQQQRQQQHEYNNDYQITAKPLYDAHQMSMHDGIATKAGKNDNDMKNIIVHGTLTASRDAAKLSKIPSSSLSSLSSSSKTVKITHTDIETMLTVVLLVLVLIVAVLVIYTVVSMRQRIKSNKHCDKTNLISSSASCSSTTSINDCEMDFNGSTASSIAQLTAIHV